MASTTCGSAPPRARARTSSSVWSEGMVKVEAHLQGAAVSARRRSWVCSACSVPGEVEVGGCERVVGGGDAHKDGRRALLLLLAAVLVRVPADAEPPKGGLGGRGCGRRVHPGVGREAQHRRSLLRAERAAPGQHRLHPRALVRVHHERPSAVLIKSHGRSAVFFSFGRAQSDACSKTAVRAAGEVRRVLARSCNYGTMSKIMACMLGDNASAHTKARDPGTTPQHRPFTPWRMRAARAARAP